MARDGLIGGEPARVWSDDDGALRLALRGLEFDLQREIVRHRDEDGAIRFSVGGEVVEYRRAGPTKDDLRWDEVDFTADEPWTWEDRDFGLFVFHLATFTGPLKYRHLFAVPPAGGIDGYRGMRPDMERFTRRLPGMREEHVRWDRLREIRAKFELSGIWADPCLLILDEGAGLAVVPVDDTSFVRTALLGPLRRLPGWDDEPLRVALEYADREPLGPRGREARDDWAERAVWKRPDG